jgi:hydroxymethylglutaryl-CoA reductase
MNPGLTRGSHVRCRSQRLNVPRRRLIATTSRLPGFYALPLQERVQQIARIAGLSPDEMQILSGQAGLSAERADQMVENVVGVHALPLGIAANFQVNGQDYLAPMAIEEPSVIAGASFAARLVRDGGGFQSHTPAPEMIAQIQVLDVEDLPAARFALLAARERILELANGVDRLIVKLGGGARDLEVRLFPDSPAGPMLVAHLVFDCRDAMGANTVNSAAEFLAPTIEELTGGRVNLRILSNLADRRLARARAVVPAQSLAFEGFAGETVVERIVEAYALAAVDPYRAATHNKGIMNGIDAVVIATGNDWRAVEAGAHAYAARSGVYTSLSAWSRTREGDLVGTLELPLALGIVGGATRAHPGAQVALKVLGVKTASELAQVVVSVGLAQNLAALRALATEGIQRGHMSLHARQIALAAGASGDEVEQITRQLVAEKTIRGERAAELLAAMRRGQS